MTKRKKPGTAVTAASILRNCAKEGDCRIWKGAYTGSGAPSIYDSRLYAEMVATGVKNRSAMRSGRLLMWELTRGQELPRRDRVLMSCTSPGCLAPWHMVRPVTHSEFVTVIAAQGAYRTLRHRLACLANVTGARAAKLNADKADQIRQRVRDGESRAKVAADMGVKRGTVDMIVRGARWQRAMLPNSSVFNLGND